MVIQCLISSVPLNFLTDSLDRGLTLMSTEFMLYRWVRGKIYE